MNNRVINSYSASSFIYVVIGLIMMIIPGMVNSSFGYFIGAICLFIGSIQMYSYLENRARVFNLVIGVLFFLFGIYLFMNPTFIASIIPFVAGIFVIINAVGKLGDLLAIKDLKSTVWISNLIVTIVLLALGIVLIFNPLGSLELLIRVFGLILFVSGVYDIVMVTNVRKRLK